MSGFLIVKKFNRTKPDLQQAIRKYEQPSLSKAVFQLVNTFIPYLLLCVLMYFSYKAGYSCWVTLGLAMVAGGLLVWVFIFFHDCAHQSFFASPKANTALGVLN